MGARISLPDIVRLPTAGGRFKNSARLSRIYFQQQKLQRGDLIKFHILSNEPGQVKVKAIMDSILICLEPIGLIWC